ncbi:MAG: biotin/lipoyl-binding protein [Candidatus Stahlbacteria bacterium]|nr:biotin/lipoyl-binding protein [Candidatus Stahlbacteria bacterium]
MRVGVIESNSPSHLSLIVNNKLYDIIVGEVQEVRPQPLRRSPTTPSESGGQNENTIYVNGEPFCVEIRDEKLGKIKPKLKATKIINVTAPMPGLIIQIEVKEGDKVKAGQGLVIVEAMKMQNEIKAQRDGIVKQIAVKKGMTVNSGDMLVVIE